MAIQDDEGGERQPGQETSALAQTGSRVLISSPVPYPLLQVARLRSVLNGAASLSTISAAYLVQATLQAHPQPGSGAPAAQPYLYLLVTHAAGSDTGSDDARRVRLALQALLDGERDLAMSYPCRVLELSADLHGHPGAAIARVVGQELIPFFERETPAAPVTQ